MRSLKQDENLQDNAASACRLSRKKGCFDLEESLSLMILNYAKN
jgi:hypothetical protein